MHVNYQAPTTGLHSPTLLPFHQKSTDYLMLAQSGKFGVNCCFIGLIHPARPAPERVCLWLFDMSTDPPLTQFAQKGCESTGLELRIPMIYLKFRRSGPVIFWRGGPENSDPPPSDWTHTYTNQKLSTWGFQVYIYLYFFYRNLYMPSKSNAYWRLLTYPY